MPVDENQNKIDINNTQTKHADHVKPVDNCLVPNNVEDPLQKARLMSFK